MQWIAFVGTARFPPLPFEEAWTRFADWVVGGDLPLKSLELCGN